MNLTPQQAAIVQAAASTDDSICVSALAGCGKSTVAAQAVAAAPGISRGGGLYVAFNKSIVGDMQGRMPAGVQVSTLHSLGYRELLSSGVVTSKSLYYKKGMRISEKVLRSRRFSKNYRPRDLYGLSYAMSRALDLMRATMTSTPEGVIDMCDDAGIDVSRLRDPGYVAVQILKECEASREIDFADMIYRTVRLTQSGRIKPTRRGFVVFDEAQDASASKRLLVQAVTGERLMVLADENQWIYGWAGSDPRAIARLADHKDAVRLPMTVTFRCSRSVTEEARKFVPEFECPADAEEGSVSKAPEVSGVRPGDMILCYRNLPLVRECVRLIKEGVSATVQGDDYYKAIASLISEGDPRTAQTAMANVERSFSRSIETLVDQVGYDLAVQKTWVKVLREKCDLAIYFLEEAGSVSAALRLVDKILGKKPEGKRYSVLLSTIHKAKGREAKRVWLLEYDDLYRKAKSDVASRNLAYVAVTRAKSDLFLVPKPA